MKFKSFIHTTPRSFLRVCGFAVVLQFVTLVSSAQTNIYLSYGYVTNITLNPGLYDITAYGARGGKDVSHHGGFGAKMKGRFSFATNVNLRLLVGGGGGNYSGTFQGGGGGGGGSFVVDVTKPLVVAGGGGGACSFVDGGPGNVSTGGNGSGGPADANGDGGGGGGGYSGNGFTAGGGGGGGGSSFLNGGAGGTGAGFAGTGGGGYGGGGGCGNSGGGGGGGYSGGGGALQTSGGGGGSIIDSSAVAVIEEASGVASPDNPGSGEIIITAVPTPIVLASASTAGGKFGFNVTGPPTNANIVIEACTNPANPAWISVATNVLTNGTNHFIDPQWTNYTRRFYRVHSP